MSAAARRRDRRGFSLAELAVTVMIVGILAGVAVPAIQYAILKADAAHMVADARTVSLAAYDYLGDHGRFPTYAPYGVVPPSLAPHLPDGFGFVYKGAQYMWYGLTFPNADNQWKTRNLGLFIVNYTQRKDLADPMRSYLAPDTYWTATYFYFLYRG